MVERVNPQRTRALAEFTEHRAHALIATDVAARGIHVDDVTSVVHFDPPEDHKAYIHRSGRTARAGQGGVVVSLIEPNGRRAARRMQSQVGIEVEIVDPDIASITSYGDPTATLAPAREVRERQRPSSKQRQGSPQPKKTGGQPGKKRRDTSQRGDYVVNAEDRKPHRGQGSRQDDQRSEARRSDSNDRPRRTTAEAQRDRQRRAEGCDGSSRNNRGERRQSGPSSHRKGAKAGQRRASFGRSPQRSGPRTRIKSSRISRAVTLLNIAHHETSALLQGQLVGRHVQIEDAVNPVDIPDVLTEDLHNKLSFFAVATITHQLQGRGIQHVFSSGLRTAPPTSTARWKSPHASLCGVA